MKLWKYLSRNTIIEDGDRISHDDKRVIDVPRADLEGGRVSRPPPPFKKITSGCRFP